MNLPLPAQISLIALGAVIGALARWQLGLWLNPLAGRIAAGTLLANWLGCLLMGVCLGLLWQSNLAETYRLLLVVGLLGSFTTFSAFSAETVTHLMTGRWQDALLSVLLHTVGGILLTLAGVAAVRYFGK